MANKVSFLDAYARRIVGWRASQTAHAGFVLGVLEQAVHDRRPVKGAGLVHHSDRGSQDRSIRYTERLGEADIGPSVGSVADSYEFKLVRGSGLNDPGDHSKAQTADAETINGVDFHPELSRVGA